MYTQGLKTALQAMNMTLVLDVNRVCNLVNLLKNGLAIIIVSALANTCIF